MAKWKKKHTGALIFTIFLCLYAIAFLFLTSKGLDYLWKYMEAYEASRPKYGIEAYMESLTQDYICDKNADLIAQIDHNVQSEEACKDVIRQAIGTEYTYVKNIAETTDNKIVYLIRAGSKVIGRAEMTPVGETSYGYTPWKVTADSYDLSDLLAPSVRVTVPSFYEVSVNGNVLSQDYITESGGHFSLLEEYYADYQLPTIVTYEAGPFLGGGEMVVKDAEGNVVDMSTVTDMNTLLPACTEEEIVKVKQIVTDFVQDYVDFSSKTGGDTSYNYRKLMEHIVPNGVLAKRMYAAIDGLYWVSDRGAKLDSIEISAYYPMGDGRYMCDLVYKVNTRNLTGQIQTESHIKITVIETDKGLLAESMVSCE